MLCVDIQSVCCNQVCSGQWQNINGGRTVELPTHCDLRPLVVNMVVTSVGHHQY